MTTEGAGGGGGLAALARFAVTRPVAVTTVAVAVVLLGLVAWKRLPQDLLPDVQSPTIVVAVRSAGRPPAEMERLYGEQVEQRLFAVRGVRRIDQVARTGRLVATIGFEWDADMDLALIDAQKAIGPLAADPDIDEVLVRRFDPRQAPVMTLGLVAPSGQPDLAELRRIARRQIAPGMERLPGVAEVRVTGGREREVRVLLDRARLDAHGLTVGTVEARLRAANVDVDAGTLEEGSSVYTLRGLSRFRSLEDVAGVVVKYDTNPEAGRVPVRVEDVAQVTEDDARVTHLVTVDGAEGVGLAIYKEAGSNTVEVSRAVRAALDALNADLPGVSVTVAADEAGLVEDAIGELQTAALAGILLAIVVIVVFLRSAGPTLIVAAAIPISVLGALLAMHLAGHTLNLMTLAGLALGVGMLADNGVVVVEAIFRRLAEGLPVRQAAWRGTADVGGAVVASTLTNVVVFLPVLFVSGLAARLVGGLAFSVVVSLLVSLGATLLVIPALAAWFLPRKPVAPLDPGMARIERLVERLLRRPWSVVAAAAAACVLAVAALAALGTELLPPADPRAFSVRLVGPAGQSVAATARTVAVVEQLIREAGGEDVRVVLAEIGQIPEDDRLIQEEDAQEHTARLTVRLAAGGPTGGQLVAAVAPAVERIPGLTASWEVGVSALARALGATRPPIAVEIAGQQLEELRDAAEILRERLAARPELWNVRSSFEGGQPELRIELDRVVADGLGVGLDTVGATLEAALDGRTATVLATGDEERNVVLRLPSIRRAELAALPLAPAGGARVTLGEVARLVPVEGAREVFRRDQRRVARITARVAPGSDYAKATAGARAAVEGADLPPGLAARVAGDEDEREGTFRDLALAGALALVLIFMVLAGTFESLIHPLTVMAAVPMALVGVAILLVPAGAPIGVIAMIGLIVMAGVAVNDAILLVDAARTLAADGMPLSAALARAAGIRLRPILMTSGTTILGLLPLAIGGSEAARLRAPMALTVIGGMAAALVGSLIVTPCLYLVLERLRPGRRA